MKPRSNSRQSQMDLFRSHFDQILNLYHPLVILADKFDWERFDVAFADCYCPDFGAPGKSIRLMVGLHYLKHAFNESDESVVERWVENPYWQRFCGFEYMQHDPPLHPTALVKWRQRVGADRLAELLSETIDLAVREKHVRKAELRQINVDTTVQEKNITHPTDSKLLYRAIIALGRAARQRGIRLRQSYVRVAKRAAVKAGRYAHAKQFKRMRRELRKLRTFLGRMLRDIGRKAATIDNGLEMLLARATRIHQQRRTDKDKLYSLHEPEVCCISKGKAHKRYEFGQKVSLATTNRGNWFVAARLCQGNPYDGHTLADTLASAEHNSGVKLTDAFVDKGYRGHDYAGEAKVHIAGGSNSRLSRSQRKRKRRRSAIEPKIGHLKSDHRMRRCFLKGLAGDATNAVLSAAGANLLKLLRRLFLALIFSVTDAVAQALSAAYALFDRPSTTRSCQNEPIIIAC
jgi:IS5 family transposase